MSMRLPRITHLQALVLEALTEEERAGRELRVQLATHKVRTSAPAFYQMMSRLEGAGLVDGWYEQKLVHGQNVKERRYRLTARGTRALADIRAFYLDRPFMLRPAGRGG